MSEPSKSRPEIALGFALATVFWIGVLGWQASHTPHEVDDQRCQQAAREAGLKQEECKTFWERTTADPVALFTLVLAVSTIGLWVATMMLYRAGEKQIRITAIAANAARDSADLARKSLYEANRPILVITPIELRDANDACARPHIHAGFRNSGSGLAFIAKVGADIRTLVNRGGQFSLESDFVAVDWHGVCEPQQTSNGFDLHAPTLDEYAVEAIRNGSGKIVVILRFTFQDVFHNPFKADFPFVYDLHRHAFVRTNSTALEDYRFWGVPEHVAERAGWKQPEPNSD